MDISELFTAPDEFADKVITVNGWVRTVRAQKKFGFIELNDGTAFNNLQLVYDEALSNFDDAAHLTVGSSLTAQGKFVLTPEGRQAFELHLTELEIVQKASGEYPLQKKRHSFEYLRTQAHLRPRTNTFSAVFRTRSVLAFAVHRFFQERGFVYTNTPIITSSDAEGAGEMFRLVTDDAWQEALSGNTPDEFFAKPAHLSVSGQLGAEAYALAFNKVYTFGPTFRAENSNTTRHASEFWMIEPEISFAGLDDIIALSEAFIKFIIKTAFEELPDEMAFFDARIEKGLIQRLKHVQDSHFASMTYTEAVDALIRSGHEFEVPVEWGIDLQSEHERYLTEEIVKAPLFVTDYPKEIKAFYMRANDDGSTVAAVDMLVPHIGEIIGGSQREEREDVLLKRMNELGMSTEPYKWYLDLRRFGGTPHAGFGVGFERLLMFITGMQNIRDVIPFPRTPGNIMF
jgi:asparaginyl-tRNA synthetase